MNTTTIMTTTIPKLQGRLVPGAQLILGCALLIENSTRCQILGRAQDEQRDEVV
jgi:hypothetical protein